MIIFLFFFVWAGLSAVLTIFTGLSYWFIPVWLILSLVIVMLMVVLSLIIGLPLAKKTKVTGKFKHWYIRNMSDFVRFFLVRVRITKVVGKENLPKDTNYVVYGNHKSNMDPLIIVSALRNPMAFAAKSSLFKYPILSGWMRSFGCININRDNDRDAIKEIILGVKLIKEGLSIAIFPEGGIKSRETTLMIQVKPGAYKLATKTGVPIVPIAVIGSRYIRFNNPKRKTKVKIIIGKPLYESDYKDMTTKEIGDYVFNLVNQMILDNTTPETI